MIRWLGARAGGTDRASWLPVTSLVAGGCVAGVAGWVAGPGVSVDSVNYLSAAEGLLEGRGWIAADGSPLAVFPPLLPLCLAVGSRLTGASPLWVALALNAVAHGLTAWVVARFLLDRLGGRRLFASLGAALVALGLPLVWPAMWVWTEPLFNLVTVVVLLGLVGVLEGPEGLARRRELLIGALACLAPLVRYIGVTLVLPAVLVFGLTAKKRPWLRAGAWAGAASLTLSVWLARNLWLTGEPTGPRVSSVYSVLDQARALAGALLEWFHLPGAPVTARVVGMVSALAVAATVGMACFRRRAFAASFVKPLWPLLLWVVVYVAALVVSTTVTNVSLIGARYAAPLYAPLIAATALFCGRAPLGTRWRRTAVAALGAWVVVSAVATWREVESARGGLGYRSAQWRGVRWDELSGLLAGRPTADIYSNFPWAIRHWTGHQAGLSPQRRYFSSNVPTEDLRKWRTALTRAESPTLLVWFRRPEPDHLYGLEVLRSAVTVRPIASQEGGTLGYEVFAVTEK